MLRLSGFELYSRWVPLTFEIFVESISTKLFVCRNKIPAFVNKRELWKTQKDAFGGHIVFFFPERGHVAVLLTLKAKRFGTLNLKIKGK